MPSVNQRQFTFLLLVAVISVLSAPAVGKTVSINAEPAHYTWSNRLSIQPNSEQIRGINAAEFDPSWTKVYEFNKKDFPAFSDEKLAFTYEGDFNRDGFPEFASVAAYRRTDGSTGSVLFIFQKSKNQTYIVNQVLELGQPAQFAIIDTSISDQLLVWFCLTCDFAAKFEWDKVKKQYYVDKRFSGDTG